MEGAFGAGSARGFVVAFLNAASAASRELVILRGGCGIWLLVMKMNGPELSADQSRIHVGRTVVSTIEAISVYTFTAGATNLWSAFFETSVSCKIR
jgi:hypothetical protein